MSGFIDLQKHFAILGLSLLNFVVGYLFFKYANAGVGFYYSVLAGLGFLAFEFMMWGPIGIVFGIAIFVTGVIVLRRFTSAVGAGRKL